MVNNEKEKFKFFDLGLMPLVNNLNDTFDESINCSRYPLSVIYDFEYQLTKLSEIVDAKILFDKYLYISGTSQPFIDHCDNMCLNLINLINIEEELVIVDIGGNDGTLLSRFKNKIGNRHKYINIDPSDIAYKASESGIEVINEYFSFSSIEKIGRKSNVIFTTNAFQHLNDIESFTKNVSLLLDDNGFWCLEFPYWLNSMNTLQFDQIYHEHIYYYNVTPLNKLFSENGLRIFDIIFQNIHGGTLRLLICKEDCSRYPTQEVVSNYLSEESKIEINFYKDWSVKINSHIEKCRKNILEISKQNEIVGFGAAAKGCIFLNYANLSYNEISYIIDDTLLKQGKFLPGTGIEIFDRNKILEKQPDYILILAHNFSKHIVKSLRDFGYKNKFIVCLPEFEIID